MLFLFTYIEEIFDGIHMYNQIELVHHKTNAPNTFCSTQAKMCLKCAFNEGSQGQIGLHQKNPRLSHYFLLVGFTF